MNVVSSFKWRELVYLKNLLLIYWHLQGHQLQLLVFISKLSELERLYLHTACVCVNLCVIRRLSTWVYICIHTTWSCIKLLNINDNIACLWQWRLSPPESINIVISLTFLTFLFSSSHFPKQSVNSSFRITINYLFPTLFSSLLILSTTFSAIHSKWLLNNFGGF